MTKTAISPELLDQLLANYSKPEDLTGEDGLFKQLKKALKEFDPIWSALNSGEQARLIRAVIDRVGYDGRTGTIAVTFRAGGFKAICALGEEVAS